MNKVYFADGPLAGKFRIVERAHTGGRYRILVPQPFDPYCMDDFKETIQTVDYGLQLVHRDRENECFVATVV